MDSQRSRLAVLWSALLAASCTTSIGPTVQVTPPSNRTQAAFAEDRRACMAATDSTLQPVADRMNAGTPAPDLVASNNARIQVLYNEDFGRCMSTRGDVVVHAVMVADQQLAGDEALPDQSQAGASAPEGPGSRDAVQALGPVITSLRHDCEGENIVARASQAALSRGVSAWVVALTEPHGGSCFGEPGENDYLVDQHAGRWSLLLAAEPGSISVLPDARLGHADVELHSLGLCVYRYGWNGSGYAIVGSHDCALPAPPTIGTLPGLIR